MKHLIGQRVLIDLDTFSEAFATVVRVEHNEDTGPMLVVEIKDFYIEPRYVKNFDNLSENTLSLEEKVNNKMLGLSQSILTLRSK